MPGKSGKKKHRLYEKNLHTLDCQLNRVARFFLKSNEGKRGERQKVWKGIQISIKFQAAPVLQCEVVL